MPIEWKGRCDGCGREVGVQLHPTGSMGESLLPSPHRITEMFDIKVLCDECDSFEAINGLRVTQNTAEL